mmetsp:Transcript_10652/g.28307  ORF Transcript_10652/g.28307 Transcript_10652/m.28307 type:complete len:256 (-) Transcript_10652:580-1347(-)
MEAFTAEQHLRRKAAGYHPCSGLLPVPNVPNSFSRASTSIHTAVPPKRAARASRPALVASPWPTLVSCSEFIAARFSCMLHALADSSVMSSKPWVKSVPMPKSASFALSSASPPPPPPSSKTNARAASAAARVPLHANMTPSIRTRPASRARSLASKAAPTPTPSETICELKSEKVTGTKSKMIPCSRAIDSCIATPCSKPSPRPYSRKGQPPAAIMVTTFNWSRATPRMVSSPSRAAYMGSSFAASLSYPSTIV